MQTRAEGSDEIPRQVPQKALRNLWFFFVRQQGYDAGTLGCLLGQGHEHCTLKVSTTKSKMSWNLGPTNVGGGAV